MQQGPSSLPENQVYLRDWTIRLDSAARVAGARSALYQVWPAAQYASSFDAVRESYRNAGARGERDVHPSRRSVAAPPGRATPPSRSTMPTPSTPHRSAPTSPPSCTSRCSTTDPPPTSPTSSS